MVCSCAPPSNQSGVCVGLVWVAPIMVSVSGLSPPWMMRWYMLPPCFLQRYIVKITLTAEAEVMFVCNKRYFLPAPAC